MSAVEHASQVGSTPIHKGYVDLEFGQIHYRSVLTAQKPLLLFFHQSPSSSVMYIELMMRLRTDFDVLALDTPGFGGSDAMPGAMTIAALTQTLKAAKDAVDERPCFVFGHHTGAALAVQMAADYPDIVQALALSGPPLLSQSQRENLVSRASLFPFKEDGSHLLPMWRRVREKDQQADLQLTQREVILAFLAEDAYPASYKAVVDQDLSGLLGKIICPTLVFAGDEDPLYGSVTPTLSCLKNGERAEISAGCKTFICDRQANEVSALLQDFFKKYVNHQSNKVDGLIV